MRKTVTASKMVAVMGVLKVESVLLIVERLLIVVLKLIRGKSHSCAPEPVQYHCTISSIPLPIVKIHFVCNLYAVTDWLWSRMNRQFQP